MQTVQFQSTSDNPTDFNASPQRTLTWSVFDGTAITTATTTLDITAVNDAPVNTVPGAQSVAEDTILPIAGVSVADIDSSALTTTLSVANGILNVTAGAGVTGNGTASVTIAGTAAQINAALAGLAYTGNLNFNGGDTLTVVTSDGTATDTDTIAITVNPVNDAPINTVPAAQSVAEDTTLPIAGVSVADIDSSALTTTLNVSSGILNVTAGAGVTGNGTASVTITGTAAQINTALAGLAYTGNLNFNGADTLTVATSDGTATDTDTIAITVNPVNDAPVNTVPAAQSVAEDTILPIAGVSVADSDSSALTTTLSVAHGILNVTAGAGVTGNGTASVTIAGTAAQINAALAGLAYTGNLNFNGADTLTVATNDGTATDTDTIAITVNPVNDAPINTVPAAQSVAEDTMLPIAGVSVADIDSSALTTTLNVSSGILNVTAGAGVTGNGTASVTITGTAAQINAALAGLAYTGNLNFNGADTLTVATSDGTATDTDTIAITVNPVNDAPINTVPAAQSVAEDTILPIAGVSVADSDSSALTTTLSVAHGILNVTAGAGVTGNGTASVTIAGTAAQINAALAGLAYTGNLNFNGADTLTVATNDGTATDTDTIAITVNPVNDAPINTVPAAQTVAEDTTLPIAGVSVADIDSSTLTTLLSVAHGTLNVTAGAGVITGNGTATVTIAGTAAQINTALAGLAYTGNLNFNGADTLTVATIDGTAADIDTIAITVNPVNDAPALNLDADSSTTGGVDYLTTFTGSAVAIVDTDVSVIDNDSPSLASATITLTNPHAGDSLIVHTSSSGRHHGERLRSRHRGPHAHGRRIGCRLSDGTAANHVRQHRHQSFDRNPHHRRGRQRWNGGKQYCACDRRGHPSQHQCTHPRSRRQQLDAPRNKLPHDVHRERAGGRNCGHRYPHRRSRYRQHDRFSHHHADEPADRRSADRHPAVAGRYHRFRLRPGHRNPDALQRRFVRRLRDCAGGDPLQLGWRQSGCGKPHHSSRRQ